MSDNKRKTAITIIVIFDCMLMYFIEMYVKPGYMTKSIYKIFLFAVLPMIYCAFDKNIRFKEYFKVIDKKQIKISAALGIGVYLFILAGYFVLKSFINLDNIALQLNKNLNVNRDNFVFVALYISFINSMLEELFFRGFCFFTLLKNTSRTYAYLISAFAFSVYHVSILANWFNVILFSVFILGLFAAGMLFNFLNEKYNNIYNSWIVHMCANLSINTIGFMMFGII